MLDGVRRATTARRLHEFAIRLPDGRYVAARIDRPPWPPARNPLAYLALIAAVTGLAAYPVVRHLTRRLEKLRNAVRPNGAAARCRAASRSRARDEVAAVAAAFNQAAERIERMIAAHRSLLANASHELRSPLARLRMAIDLYGAAAGEAVRSARSCAISPSSTRWSRRSCWPAGSTTPTGWSAPRRSTCLALVAEEGARHDASVTGEPATVAATPAC